MSAFISWTWVTVMFQHFFNSSRFPASEVQAGGPGWAVSLPPPVEPLLVARRTPLSMVKKAAEEHMAGIYSMLEHWQVSQSFSFLYSFPSLLL